MQGHVRAVAEAHPVCCGVASGSVVLRVSGARQVVTTVAPGVTRCRVDPLAEMRGISLAVARSPCPSLLPCPTLGIPEKFPLMTALFGSVGDCSGPSGHRASSLGGHG
jgi:hypothetical protein